jgi:hypothetical protein
LPIDYQVAANSTKQVLIARAPKRKIVGMFFFFLMLKAGNYYFKELLIKQSTYNPYLLYSKEPFSVISLQTNNTLFVRNNYFAKKEQVKLEEAKFIAKEQKRFTLTYNLKFNSSIIHL